MRFKEKFCYSYLALISASWGRPILEKGEGVDPPSFNTPPNKNKQAENKKNREKKKT